MATTIVTKFDQPIGMTMEQVRELAQDMLERLQGDCDKSGDIEDNCYYQGGVDALTDLLFSMTFPRTEDDARECVHGHQVWFGNECGLCETSGYKFKDAS
jgi:hypothetical protein